MTAARTRLAPVRTELAANGTGSRVTESPRRDLVLSADLGDAARSVAR
jgi:hypothetical protein